MDNWEAVDPAVPMLLLPVRIETRSTPDRSALRVRIYPDDVHVDMLDAALSPDERMAGIRYWRERWPVDRPVEASDPWTVLVGAVGTRRAAWVAAILTPMNLPARPVDPPEFPDIPDAPDVEGVWARLLPDCFRVVVDQAGVRTSMTGTPIAREGLALGPGLDLRKPGATEKLGAMVDSLRRQPGIDPSTDIAWLTDYDAAEAAGMAVTVPLPDRFARIDHLYAIGVRAAESPETTADELAHLLRAHAFGDGLAFVPPGTVTNNTTSSKSAWSRAARTPGEPPIDVPPPDPAANAQVLATALGISPTDLTGLDEANRTDQSTAAAFATALWPVTWETFLDKSLTPNAAGSAVPAAARDAVREHAAAHVRGLGPLPTMRIGNQPYGILPTTTHGAAWKPRAGDYIDQSLAALLSRIRPLWTQATHSVPTVTSGDLEKDLPHILGQTPVSRGLRVRSAIDAQTAKPIPPSLGTTANSAAQHAVTVAVEALIGTTPGVLVPPDLLGKSTRNLALPLAHDSDPDFCSAILRIERLPEVHSVLQALLGLAEAKVRHEVEEFFRRERLQQLQIRLGAAQDFVSQDVIDLGLAALQRLSDRSWDERELYRDAATALERSVGPFEPAQFAARFPIVSLRPHLTDAIGDVIEGVRAAAAALRAAQRLGDIRAAITSIAGIDSTDERALFLAGTLDCTSHRLDAWLTSLATRRLTAARTNGIGGIVVGAYGWVEGFDLAPPVEVDVPGQEGPVFEASRDGGHILAPSPAHAATAAVLRGAHLTHDPGDTGRSALNIDLSSTRTRAAMSVLDGIRSGQPMGALLGYRLEQWLHIRTPEGRSLHRFIYCLRSLAPIVAAKATDRTPAGTPVPESLESVAASEVVDGLRLLELFRAEPSSVLARLTTPPDAYKTYIANWAPPTPDEIGAVSAAIERLDRLHDAIADLLLAESVHQLVLGSAPRAAAAMDALSGDGMPPIPDVVKTPKSGVGLTHRILVGVPDGAVGVADGWAVSARAKAHPAWEKWTREGFGPADLIRLGPGITLADAHLGALDFLVAAGNSPAPFWALLRRRVPGLAVEPESSRPAGLAANALIFTEAWSLAGSLRNLMVGTRAVGPEDLVPPGEAGSTNTAERRPIDRADLEVRAGAAVTALGALIDSVDEPIARVDAFALFGLGMSGDPTALPDNELAAHIAGLNAGAQRRFATADALLTAYNGAPPDDDARAQAALAEVISQVFDDKLPVLPVIVQGPDPLTASLAAGVPVLQENREVSDGRDIRPWLTRIARVRPAVTRYTETLLLREALGHRVPLRVGQLPGGAFDTWIGLPFGKGTLPPDVSVTGFVVEATADALPGRCAGFVVDEWTDVVPRRVSVRDQATGEPTGAVQEVGTAGLAVNANGPNARAPQVLLLAVSPDGTPWSPDKVIDLLRVTYTLAQERAVTLERLPLAGRLLPATYVQDWSLQGEPVLDIARLVMKADVTEALLTHVAEKS